MGFHDGYVRPSHKPGGSNNERYEDAEQVKLACDKVELGVWEHYKGGLYLVFATSLMEDTLIPLVHYFSLEKGTRWTRTQGNFLMAWVEPGSVERTERFVWVRPCTLQEMAAAAG